MTIKKSSRGVEDADLRRYYKYLKLKRWDANYYHVANELPATTPQQKRFAATLVHKGKKPGFSDIVILESHQGYGALFIELKTKTGIASMAQLAFLSNANNNGYLGCVAFGYDEAIKITNWYMSDSKEPMPLYRRTRTASKIKFENVLEVVK